MTAVAVAEAIVLVLLVLLVAGLLRSHAEILRRLDAIERDRPTGSGLPGVLDPALASPANRTGAAAADIAGLTPAGDAAQISPARSGRPTLLAFLTSGCSVCGGFWRELAADRRPALPDGAHLQVITKGPEQESPTRLSKLAPAGLPVLMSTGAWSDYAVPGAPYFVYIEAGGRVAGEGAAVEWSQLASLLADAIADSNAGDRDRGRRVDDELSAAGLRPGDPSLWGGR